MATASKEGNVPRKLERLRCGASLKDERFQGRYETDHFEGTPLLDDRLREQLDADECTPLRLRQHAAADGVGYPPKGACFCPDGRIVESPAQRFSPLFEANSGMPILGNPERDDSTANVTGNTKLRQVAREVADVLKDPQEIDGLCNKIDGAVVVDALDLGDRPRTLRL